MFSRWVTKGWWAERDRGQRIVSAFVVVEVLCVRQGVRMVFFLFYNSIVF